MSGLTKRDIQLVVDGGFNTVESVAYTPRRVLEQIKGISEQKAGKILAEGTFGSIATISASRPMLTINQPLSLSPWASPRPRRCTNAAAS